MILLFIAESVKEENKKLIRHFGERNFFPSQNHVHVYASLNRMINALCCSALSNFR